MSEIKVSVIIPVYGVEKFIERCSRSLFSQTLNNGVEFIFVDDATPDNSIKIIREVINDYPERSEQVKIVTHDHNIGLPQARNTGLAAAEGEYIFHCDSDDYIESNLLELMYNAAVSKDADFVWCNWFLTLADSERCMKEPTPDAPENAVKLMLSGAMKFNVWNKLVKRDLYIDNNISFPEHDGMGEDMTMILLCANATRTAYVSEHLYHYVKTNTGAFSNTYSEQHLIQLRRNVDRVAQYLTSKFGSLYKQELSYLKLDVKFPFLLMNSKKFRELWKQWYPEANRYILENKNVSLRTRMVQWCAANNLWLWVKAYSFLLNRIVYGR